MDGETGVARADELAAAFRVKRDPRNCAILYEQLRWWVIWLLRRWGVKKDVVEDLCQDVFIKFFNSPFEEGRPPKQYLRKTARAVWVDYIKSLKPGVESVGDEFVDDVETPLENTIRGERMRVVKETVALLPAKYNIVLVLHYLESKRISEVADVLAISQGLVRTRLCRARKLLHQSLGHV